MCLLKNTAIVSVLYALESPFGNKSQVAPHVVDFPKHNIHENN